MFRWFLRVILLVVPLAQAIAAALMPAWRKPLVALAIGSLLAFGVVELFWPGAEPFVGLRYLHSSRRPRGALAGLASTVGLAVIGALIFVLARRYHARGWETVGVVAVLAGSLFTVLALLLQLFSVFSTVSAMGVVLGVASLIVVMAVTSGF